MKDPHAAIPEQDSGDDYWLLARQPLHSLIFLVPLLAVYELGVFRFGSTGDEIRNGADYWMRTGLKLAGLEYPWTLPLIVLGLLFLWQLAGRYRWRLSAGTLIGMLAESLLFGGCLIVLGQLQELAFRQHLPAALPLTIPHSQTASLQQAVSFVGAGIYEEVLFRLAMLPVLCGLLRLIRFPRALALLLAMIATSALFSGAHYVGPAADTWSLYSFTFRLVAGGFFAALFVLRGFGITVGAHAAYDLMVGIILPEFAGSLPGS
jgi:hypothetical protein